MKEGNGGQRKKATGPALGKRGGRVACVWSMEKRSKGYMEATKHGQS